jgi:hypothetical protein
MLAFMARWLCRNFVLHLVRLQLWTGYNDFATTPRENRLERKTYLVLESVVAFVVVAHSLTSPKRSLLYSLTARTLLMLWIYLPQKIG